MVFCMLPPVVKKTLPFDLPTVSRSHDLVVQILEAQLLRRH